MSEKPPENENVFEYSVFEDSVRDFEGSLEIANKLRESYVAIISDNEALLAEAESSDNEKREQIIANCLKRREELGKALSEVEDGITTIKEKITTAKTNSKIATDILKKTTGPRN